MRDRLKDKTFFEKKIDDLYTRLDRRYAKLEKKLINEDRLQTVKKSMSYQYLSILRLKYCSGEDMFSNDVYEDYKTLCSLTSNYWEKNNLNVLFYLNNDNPIHLNQYTLSSHLEFIDILSIGVLLNIPNEYFKLITDFIDKDEVKDFVFEFLIRQKLEKREIIKKESFQVFSWYKDRFTKIKHIIKLENKEIAQKELKAFLEKDWYNTLKDTPIYNQHNIKNGNYVGYWCFLAAAIVKIKKLDDSSFRDNKYYPKDLV